MLFLRNVLFPDLASLERDCFFYLWAALMYDNMAMGLILVGQEYHIAGSFIVAR